MPKIFVIHASFGQGHKQAALAISSYLKVPCFDLLDFTFPVLKKIQASAYLYITKNIPFLWQLFFDISRFKNAGRILKILNILTYFPLINYLKKTKPDIIITTHFFPPHIMAHLKKKLGFFLISVVTDIEPHPQWESQAVDKFFVATEQSKQWLKELGVAEAKISPGYIAVREGFLEKEDKQALSRKLNFDSSRQTILFLPSGKESFSFLERVILRLIQEFNLIIIYGKNKRLKDFLRQANLKNLAYFSFYQKMWELVSLAALIIAKPGGLTVFEGCYKKKAFIFTHFIPGQEEENMNLLIRHNLAKAAFSYQELIDAAIELTRKESLLQKEYPLEFKDIRAPLSRLIDAYAQSR